MPPIIDTAALAARAISAQDLRARFEPNDAQKVTLIVAACYIVAIGILPILENVLYPFKLLTVGLHEMCHALAGVLTYARVESIQLDPYEGGATRMRGGIQLITLPAGYLGSSFIGAGLIACGFDTNASKIASIVLGVLFMPTLYWARKSWVAWVTILGAVALTVICWLVAHSVALRFLVLFLGVMSCLYCIWDVIDDTLKRKVNSSDASAFAQLIGVFGPRVWGVLWLLSSIAFFIGGILVGLVTFKDDWTTQAQRADKFLGGSP